MAILAALPGLIWELIKNLPEFLSLIKTITGMFIKWHANREAAAKLKELHTGLKEGHKEGDTSGLEKLFNGGSAPAVPPGNK